MLIPSLSNSSSIGFYTNAVVVGCLALWRFCLKCTFHSHSNVNRSQHFMSNLPWTQALTLFSSNFLILTIKVWGLTLIKVIYTLCMWMGHIVYCVYIIYTRIHMSVWELIKSDISSMLYSVTIYQVPFFILYLHENSHSATCFFPSGDPITTHKKIVAV